MLSSKGKLQCQCPGSCLTWLPQSQRWLVRFLAKPSSQIKPKYLQLSGLFQNKSNTWSRCTTSWLLHYSDALKVTHLCCIYRIQLPHHNVIHLLQQDMIWLLHWCDPATAPGRYTVHFLSTPQPLMLFWGPGTGEGTNIYTMEVGQVQ